MSYFGDHTPQQDLLEQVEYIKAEHALTTRETVILLLQISSAIADPLGDIAEQMRSNQSRQD